VAGVLSIALRVLSIALPPPFLVLPIAGAESRAGVILVT
jgi:hypothetical protein